jgi:hypothetical protein
MPSFIKRAVDYHKMFMFNILNASLFSGCEGTGDGDDPKA